MAGSDCEEMIELGDEWGMKYEAQFIVDPIARDRPRSENGGLTLMGSKGGSRRQDPLTQDYNSPHSCGSFPQVFHRKSEFSTGNGIVFHRRLGKTCGKPVENQHDYLS